MNAILWIVTFARHARFPRGALALALAASLTWPALPASAAADVLTGSDVRRSQESPASARLSPTAKPDLTIVSFTQLRGNGCGWGDHWYHFRVTVRNVGNATAPAGTYVSLAITDWHTGPDGRTRYGGSLTAVPVPPPGGTETVTLGVGGWAEYRHVVGSSPHPFRAAVDWDNKIDELDETNNVSATSWAAAPGCLTPK